MPHRIWLAILLLGACNPTVMKTLLAAFDEAAAMIAKDPEDAAKTYLAMTKEKLELAEVVALITGRGSVFKAAPVRTQVYADYMYKFGYINKKPESWKDYFFPKLHGRDIS